MAEAAPVPPPAAQSTRGRAIAAVVCLVLAAVLTVPASFAYWGQRTINDGSRYVETVGPLVDSPEVQAAITTKVSDAIQSQVGVRPTTCAYPYGSNNAAVLAVAENQFKACRSTQGGFNKRGRLLTHDLFSYNVHRGTTAAQIRKAAEQARSSNTWVVFVYHGVDPRSKGADDVTPKLFAAHMDALVSTGIPVQTVESALAAMSR